MAITTSGTSITFNDATTQTTAPVNTNANVNSVSAGTGISVSATTGALTVTNSGVTSVAAGTGISVSASTGGVTISSSSGTPNLQFSLALYGSAVNSNGTPLVWNSNGNLTFTPPTGVTRVKLFVIAGGGGGAGNNCGGGQSGGYGGAGVGIYTVTPGTGYTVTVGVGGASQVAPSSGSGSAGGSSSFGSLLTATGGGGGIFGSADGANGSAALANIRNSNALGTTFDKMVSPWAGQNASAGTGTTSQTVWSVGSRWTPGSYGVATSGAAGGLVYIEYVG